MYAENLPHILAGRTCVGNEKKSLEGHDRLKFVQKPDGQLQCYNITALDKIWTKIPSEKGIVPGSTSERVPDEIVAEVDQRPQPDTSYLNLRSRLDQNDDEGDNEDVKTIANYLSKKKNPTSIQTGSPEQVVQILDRVKSSEVQKCINIGDHKCGELSPIQFRYNVSKSLFQCLSKEHLILEIETKYSSPVIFGAVREEIEDQLLPILNEIDNAVFHLPGLKDVRWKEKGLVFRVHQLDDGRLQLISLFSTVDWNQELLAQLALLLRTDVNALVNELSNGRTLRCGPDLTRRGLYFFRPATQEGYIFRRNGKYVFEEDRPIELERNPFVEDTERYIRLWRELSFSQYEILLKFGKMYDMYQKQAYALICDSIILPESPVLELYTKLLHQHAQESVTSQDITRRSIHELEMSLFRCVSHHSPEKCLPLQSRFELTYPDIVRSMQYLRILSPLQQWIVNQYTINDYAFNKPLKAVTQDPVSSKVRIREGHWKLVSTMDQILAQAPKTTRPLFVFRGVDLDDHEQLRTSVTTFTSVTYTYESAGAFAGMKCCMMAIRVAIGTPITAIDELSHFHRIESSENEILLPRNSVFVPVDDDDDEFLNQMHEFVGRDHAMTPNGPKLKLYDLRFSQDMDNRLYEYVKSHPDPSRPKYKKPKSEAESKIVEWVDDPKIVSNDDIEKLILSDEFTTFLKEVVIDPIVEMLLNKYGLVDEFSKTVYKFSLKFIEGTAMMDWMDDDDDNVKHTIQTKLRETVESQLRPKHHRILL